MQCMTLKRNNATDGLNRVIFNMISLFIIQPGKFAIK